MKNIPFSVTALSCCAKAIFSKRYFISLLCSTLCCVLLTFHSPITYLISVYSVSLELSVFVPQTLTAEFREMLDLQFCVSGHNTTVHFFKNNSSPTPLVYLMLRNLEDAVSEGKLSGDAWWKLKKETNPPALKRKRDQIKGCKKS